MKKRIMAAILCALTMFSVCACDSNGGINLGGLGSKPATPPSITTLAAYEDLDVILTGEYEITQEKIYEYFNQMLCKVNAGLIRVKDRNVVQAGDVVQIDYTGYLDGTAFAGGAAKNQIVDVSKNCMFDESTGETGTTFIDKFCEGLIGATVDVKASHQVKFPDKYSQESLAGKNVTFEFNVDRIYVKATPETVDDAYIEEHLGDKGYKTVEELRKYCEEEVVFSTIMGYILEKSKVNIPEAYLNERFNQYTDYLLKLYEENYGKTTSIELLVSNSYGMTLDSVRPYWLSYIKQQVNAEVVFAEIVKSKSLTHDQKEVDDFIAELMSKNNSYKEVEDVYEVMAYGNAEKGEQYLGHEFAVKNHILQLYEATKAVTQ